MEGSMNMNKMKYILLVITTIVLVGISALALDIPHTFTDGTVISASEMNANFVAVKTAVEANEAAIGAVEANLAALEATVPGVAHTKVTGRVNVTNTIEAQDIVVVTITAPANGVIMVQATAQAGFVGTTNANYFSFQIDTAAGGSASSSDSYYAVGTLAPANDNTVWHPIAIQRAFIVAAGTHTYRLEAQSGPNNGVRWLYNPSITATYYPVTYGDVDLGVTGAVAQPAANQ
jgi:hypothetical protein